MAEVVASLQSSSEGVHHLLAILELWNVAARAAFRQCSYIRFLFLVPSRLCRLCDCGLSRQRMFHELNGVHMVANSRVITQRGRELLVRGMQSLKA